MKENFRSQIERIREANDIVEVVSEHLTLDRGNKALCPFHDEKTPSFHVNQKGQYFKCFGCGVGGDVFKFIELIRGVPFMDALGHLAARAGVPLEEISPDELFRIKEKRQAEDVLAAAADFYHARLTQAARDYLYKRGLTDETIVRFKIGFAAGGLLDHLTRERDFPIEACLRAGVVKKTNGGKGGDYFRDRVIFPNIVRGRVVHLSGRTLRDSEPRYLHLPGEIRFFFNEEALRSSEVIITEGILDCLPAVQAGFACAAIYGTSRFKEDDLPRLSAAATVYLCLDGDKAGRTAASRIASLIGERVRVVSLPEETDLGDYLRDHPPADLQELLAAAPGLVSHELSKIPSDTPKTELPRLLKPVLKLLARLGRPEAEAYLGHEIKKQFKLKKEDADAYRADVRKYRSLLEKEQSPAEGEGATTDFLWEDFEPFNPAQDFQKGKAYFTVYLQKVDQKDGSLERLSHVVTSDRELFPLEKTELDRRGLRLLREGQVPSDMNRWSISDRAPNSVHAFIQDEASVDPVDLFDEIRSLFATYLDYTDPLYHDFISLWCLGTYFFMGFESYPYVFL
ncbi:MAG: CHC2 zinc finger domain-containing protein, partial [Candidatus Erginobacter occultus]|nr:CHC2 zinc finger domain-containing protein [Candidatus Erginobacter occultus]